MKIISKIAFITGATSGIGRATSQLFAKNGYNLILLARREERLIEIQKKLTMKYGVEIKILVADVRHLDAVRKVYKSLKPDWRKIDILVNNAGLAKGFDPIHQGNIEHWDTMIDTNIKGLLYVTRVVSPDMVKRGTGHVINICSTAGHEVYPNGNVYSATKHAVDALTKSMRLDFYKLGLRVSQVSPGHVEETEFALVRYDGEEKRAKIYDDFNPLKSKDVADAIFYIASRPKNVNIQDILLMGRQQASSNFIDRSGRSDN